MGRRPQEAALGLIILLLLCILTLTRPGPAEFICPECEVCPAGFATIEDMMELVDEKEVLGHRLEACQETIIHCDCTK